MLLDNQQVRFFCRWVLQWACLNHVHHTEFQSIQRWEKIQFQDIHTENSPAVREADGICFQKGRSHKAVN